MRRTRFFARLGRARRAPSRLPWAPRTFPWAALAALAFTLVGASAARAEVVTLKNGIQLEGTVGKIAKIGQNPFDAAPGSETEIKQIVLVDDDLRRVFVPSKLVASYSPAGSGVLERVRVRQRVAESGQRLGSVGAILRVTEFDEYGRRVFSMSGPKGRLDVVQGITEITPRYTKVEGLLGKTAFVWDMRIATSGIPRETLSKVLYKQIDPQNPDDRMRVVRLYIQADRFQDARLELEGVLRDFPELTELKKQVDALRQTGARRLIQEIELRRDAGQHVLAFNMLANFPAEGVAGETLLRVRDLLKEFDDWRTQGERVVQLLDEHRAALANEAARKQAEAICNEIKAELTFHGLPRMADYLRLADDAGLSAEQKLSLAISGWLLGGGAGVDNLAVSLSLVDVRNAARGYLAAGRAAAREAALADFEKLEGATPANMAKLLAQMKPPLPAQPAEGAPPGYFRLATPGLSGDPDIVYHLQLPPGYDPYRRYPCVVTLHGSGSTATQQLDWWAGGYNAEAQARFGQATRRGYIVVAPEWAKPHQVDYDYSAREHSAVLYSLRDACQRFSIDTNRVFLSGHSIGGDCAWDVALAHPDVWAGMIAVVATADKYVARYWENGRYVPMYFVAGEMDGDRLERNAQELNRYLTRVDYDCAVVQYRGRGHEHFHDEILHLFAWMDKHRRDFNQREFKCASMRAWDNFFWWVEARDMPAKSLVAPLNWPPEGGVRPHLTEARVLENNGVSVKTGAVETTIYFTPAMVKFEERVVVNGRGMSVTPGIKTMLEDAATRGDRQNVFWAKVELVNGRVKD